MRYSQPITTIVRRRFSCRSYENRPIAPELRRQLADHLAAIRAGPLGTPLRFALVSATEQDGAALRGLGTYGFIRNPTAFIVGAMGPGEKNLEDYGCALEEIVLYATDLGLGTCWLGGTFTKSGFARRIGRRRGEDVPAVVAAGYCADPGRGWNALVRRTVGAHHRLPWEALFFDGEFGRPLSRTAAGPYAEALEMVRLAPSASNKQPWRIVRREPAWHFYLQRTPGYAPGSYARLVGIADLQRVDLGIAMSHWALTAVEAGLKGEWIIEEPALPNPGRTSPYIVSWLER